MLGALVVEVAVAVPASNMYTNTRDSIMVAFEMISKDYLSSAESTKYFLLKDLSDFLSDTDYVTNAVTFNY